MSSYSLTIPTDFGTFSVVTENGVAVRSGFGIRVERPTQNSIFTAPLENYFSGKNFDLSTIPVSVIGTDFERAVCKAMCKIPLGKTMSYSELAKRSGYPGAARAVGSACRKNPLPILIPCHRVVKSDGSIGEYVYGANVKKSLLALEQNQSSN